VVFSALPGAVGGDTIATHPEDDVDEVDDFRALARGAPREDDPEELDSEEDEDDPTFEDDPDLEGTGGEPEDEDEYEDEDVRDSGEWSGFPLDAEGDAAGDDDDEYAESPRAEEHAPVVIPRAEHGVSRSDIDPDALKILYRLHQNGHKGYLVGGGVRDLMLGLAPKDFDIATDARPRRLRRLFRNCRIIGRRFRLAHIHFPDGKVIEVATFRSSGESDAIVREGDLIHRDNVYGTPEEDARRRDLTINGLFYDIGTFAVIDYVGGVEDLRARRIRTIAEPTSSFREDPVRMLRAIRHATRLGFEIDPETRRAMETEREEILKANEARLLEELYKDLASGRSRAFFEELHRSGFLELLLAPVVASFRQRGERKGKAILGESLERLDRLQAEGREITHTLAIAALLAPLILPVARGLEGQEDDAVHPDAFRESLAPAFARLKIYRRDEERLWHVLGAWGRVDRSFHRGSIPKSLARRHYFPEAVEVYALLSPESEDLLRFRDYVRSLPPPAEEEPPPGRRARRGGRRRGGRGGRGGGGEGREASPPLDDRRGDGPPTRKKRRRRRQRGARP